MAIKKKDQAWTTPVDPDLNAQARGYAQTRGVSLAALVRATLRFWTDPDHPQDLPAAIGREKKRPPRRKPAGSVSEG